MQHSPTVVEETLREAPVGKGLAATLKLLEERGALRGIDDYGGDKFSKKRKILVADDDASKKEIIIEWRDEYGRIMTSKEAFRVLSHEFHGKGSGKQAQEKRKKLHGEESWSNQLQFNTDKTSLFMGRMSELQAQSNKPYIILHSGNS